jgi:hypothetical protein
LESVTTTLETGNAEDELHDLQHASYSYDDAGNVLSVKDTPDPALDGMRDRLSGCGIPPLDGCDGGAGRGGVKAGALRVASGQS